MFEEISLSLIYLLEISKKNRVFKLKVLVKYKAKVMTTNKKSYIYNI